MLEIRTTITYDKQTETLWGKIYEDRNIIELELLLTSFAKKNFSDTLLYQLPQSIKVLDGNGKAYIVYDCKFTKQTLHFGTAGLYHFEGVFSRLIQENEANQQYNVALWGFEGIEKFFPLEKFDTIFESDTENLQFIKEKTVPLKFQIADDINCEIISSFSGVVKSSALYEPKITQRKLVKLIFSQEKSVNELLETIKKVKEYFEFLTKQELNFTSISFCADGVMTPAILLIDPILAPKTIIKPIKNRPYNNSIDTLFKGLIGWLKEYENYKSPLKIWRKTIYNSMVSKEDLFIWKCQTFEYLCTLNQTIFEKAKETMMPKQSFPNLRNFLLATNDIYSITKNIDPKYFTSVKEVRDKLTHNNPQKVVTELQKENSFELIEYFLSRTIQNIMDIKGVSGGVLLRPEKLEN